MTKAEDRNPSLRELMAVPVALPVGTLTLQIAPMGWYQASQAVEHLLPVIDALPLLAGDGAGEDRAARWAGAVITYRNEIAAFCAEASALPIDEVRALPPTAMVELVVGLMEINLDFFVRSLPGLAQRARGRLAALTDKLAPVLAQIEAAAPGSTTSSSAS